MDELSVLRVERDSLESRLLLLEWLIEELSLEGMAPPELIELIPPLVSQLRLVNARLTELRDPAAPAE